MNTLSPGALLTLSAIALSLVLSACSAAPTTSTVGPTGDVDSVPLTDSPTSERTPRFAEDLPPQSSTGQAPTTQILEGAASVTSSPGSTDAEHPAPDPLTAQPTPTPQQRPADGVTPTNPGNQGITSTNDAPNSTSTPTTNTPTTTAPTTTNTPTTTAPTTTTTAPTTTNTPTTTAPTTTPPSQPTVAILNQLTIADESETNTYSRDSWEHWEDVNGSGCRARDDVLAEESLIDYTVDGRCDVQAGYWYSAFDGVDIWHSDDVQIDHFVPLYEAHKSGGAGWSPARKKQFANDTELPEALIAVSGISNQDKGADDPAQWRPVDPATWCWYATSWVKVKSKWGLSVDPVEYQALAQMLTSCSADYWTPPTSEAAVSVGTSPDSGDCDTAYPGVCIPVSATDLDCWQIVPRRFPVGANDPHNFDGDRNGVGCEFG